MFLLQEGEHFTLARLLQGDNSEIGGFPWQGFAHNLRSLFYYVLLAVDALSVIDSVTHLGDFPGGEGVEGVCD